MSNIKMTLQQHNHIITLVNNFVFAIASIARSIKIKNVKLKLYRSITERNCKRSRCRKRRSRPNMIPERPVPKVSSP